MNFTNIISRIKRSVEPDYTGSKFYATVWNHVLAVAEFAKEFALQTGANVFVAETAGLLHDLGGAKFGREDHHKTGVKEASWVLLECDCPPEFTWPILQAIRTHRGSQKIPFATAAGVCVAAADAKDHFIYSGELWLAMAKSHDISDPRQIYNVVCHHLENDWEKTSREIKVLLWKDYEKALLEIADFASGEKMPQIRQLIALRV